MTRATLASTGMGGSATASWSLLLAWRVWWRWCRFRWSSWEAEMGGIIRDVLDKQLVDRQQRKMGKVDGLIVELRDGQPPRLAYITVGGTTLARRLHPRLAQWLVMLARRWGIGRGEPF